MGSIPASPTSADFVFIAGHPNQPACIGVSSYALNRAFSRVEVFLLPEIRQSDVLHMHVLSKLVLAPDAGEPIEEFKVWDGFWLTADAHHVPVRAFGALKRSEGGLHKGLDSLLDGERARVAGLMENLPVICRELEAGGIRVAVIKSLDHWPDFGSDIDLFTEAPEGSVSAIMRSRFDAKIVPATIGDRLANKVNYQIPGLRELVEVHFGRLGQTGEHMQLARRILAGSRIEEFNGVALPVPAPEERLLLAALQRMYRHFLLRICDVANTARIVDSGQVDFDELRHASKAAGIWPGVATYLNLVSQYVEHYRGHGLRLPYRVLRAARFGLGKVYPHAGFLRLPLFPQAASLYTRQLARSVGRDPTASLRLTLLPPLAAAAGTKYRVTGSDKGIW